MNAFSFGCISRSLFRVSTPKTMSEPSMGGTYLNSDGSISSWSFHSAWYGVSTSVSIPNPDLIPEVDLLATDGVGDACLESPLMEPVFDFACALAASSCTFSSSNSFFSLSSRKAYAAVSARSALPLEATDCRSSVRLITLGCPGAAAAAFLMSTGVELVPDEE